MLHLSSSGAAKLLSGDDTENENDELNGEDIDTTWRLVFFYFLPLFDVKLSVVIGRFFEASGDTNSGIDGGVTLGGGQKFEVEEVVDLEESAGDVSFGSECLVIFVDVVSWMLVKVSLCSSNRSWIECVLFLKDRFLLFLPRLVLVLDFFRFCGKFNF